MSYSKSDEPYMNKIVSMTPQWPKRKDTKDLHFEFQEYAKGWNSCLDQCTKAREAEKGLEAELLNAAKEWIQWFDYLSAYQHENLVNGQTLEKASKNWQTMVDPSPPIDKLREAVARFGGKEKGNG